MIPPIVSILVPVYNGEKYLGMLIDCLIKQTLTNFEVIFVDDQSEDNSLQIIEYQSSLDTRFRVLKMPKKGGNAVKGIKYGLNYCNGKHFFYMSQDDLIEHDTLEKLVTTAELQNVDAVIPDMEWFFANSPNNRRTTPPNGLNYDSIIDGTTAFKLAMPWKIHGFYLRKTHLLREVGYDDSYLTGDECNSRKYLFFCNRVAFCQTTFYYRQDNTSALTKVFRPHIIEDIYSYVHLLEFMYQNSFDREFIKKWHQHTVDLIFYYRRMAEQNSATLDDTDKKSTQNILYEARNRLLKFSRNSRLFKGYLRLLRKSKINWQ